jgi:hypothetical protein
VALPPAARLEEQWWVDDLRVALAAARCRPVVVWAEVRAAVSLFLVM